MIYAFGPISGCNTNPAVFGNERRISFLLPSRVLVIEIRAWLIGGEPRWLGWHMRQASRFSVTLGQLSYLDMIRGFVAVGRRMSITLAAEDLHLTQSAVSRQV